MCFVSVPEAYILGGAKELFLEVDSTINITCVVKHSPMPPSNVQWLQDDKVSLFSLNKKVTRPFGILRSLKNMKVPRKVQMQKSASFVQCIQIKRMLSSAAED